MDREGAAQLVSIPDGVFFSPLQRLQRDLTVEVLRQFVAEREDGDGISILDALAGCGVRAIRYALEVRSVRLVVANDLKASAAEALRRNVDASLASAAVLANSCRIQVLCGDACQLMAASPKAFDVVDLDPCGSPAPFLAAAVCAVKSGGLLCLACTDFQDLVDKRNRDAAARSFARYSGWVGTDGCASSAFTTEVALRVVLRSVQLAAGAQGRRVAVVLCTALDFFLRIIVRIIDDGGFVETPPILIRKLRNDSGQSTGDYRALHFGQVIRGGFEPGGELLGPMWGATMYDLSFLKSMQQRLQSDNLGKVCMGQNFTPMWGIMPHSWFNHNDDGSEAVEDGGLAESEGVGEADLLRLRDQCLRSGRAQESSLALEALRQLVNQVCEEALVGTIPILFPFSIRELSLAFLPSGISPSSQVLRTMATLSAQGYAVSRCHSDLLSIKTTASFEVVCAALVSGLQGATPTMSPGCRGGAVLAEARTRNDDAAALEADDSTGSSQKSRKLQHVSEDDLEHLSTRNGGVGLIDGLAMSKVGFSPSVPRAAIPVADGRIIEVDNSCSTKIDLLRFRTLEEAMHAIRPHDIIILSSGRHFTPACGLLLRVPDLHFIGKCDSYICLPPSSCESVARVETTTTTGSTVYALAARIALTGVIIEASPNRHHAKKHATGPGGVPSWSGLTVEGFGNSLVFRNSRVCVERPTGKSLERGKGKGGGKGKDAKGGHSNNSFKGAGIVVASRASLTTWNASIGQEYSPGFDVGILVCGRANASLFDSLIENTASCCLLVQSGGMDCIYAGMVFGATCRISNSLSGAAASGLGSALVFSCCVVESCERVLVEVSNRARLDLRSCQLGSNLHVHGSIIGKVNGGCDGGGVLIRHTGTSARIHKCLVSSTRLAAVDVRSGARLVLGRTLLSRGRTSGLFISESAAVSLGVGCAIVGMRIAAVEIETNAQVVCESKMIAQRILRLLEGATGAKDIDDEIKAAIDAREQTDSLIVMGCSPPALVSSGAAFGFLE